MQHDLLLLLDLQHFVLSLSPVVPRQPSFIFSSIRLNFLEHALFDPRFKHSPSFLFPAFSLFLCGPSTALSSGAPNEDIVPNHLT